MEASGDTGTGAVVDFLPHPTRSRATADISTSRLMGSPFLSFERDSPRPRSAATSQSTERMAPSAGPPRHPGASAFHASEYDSGWGAVTELMGSRPIAGSPRKSP